MTKRTIEIEDNSREIIESAIDDTKTLFNEWLDENADLDDLESVDVPCLYNDLDYSGSFHEIIDSAVPIYTNEIRDLFYLYGNDIESAFEDHFGADSKTDTGWPMGWQAAAIYCWIESQVAEFYNENSEEWLEQWLATKQAKTAE